MTTPYAPQLGIEAPQGAFDPEQATALMWALRMHEGRYLILPRLVNVASPASGQDWGVAVPGGKLWVPVSIAATLNASGAVANRQARLTVSDGSTVLPIAAAVTSVVAGQHFLHVWGRGQGVTSAIGSAAGAQSSLPLLPVLENWTVGTSTSALDASDNWTGVTLYVLEIRQRTPNERAAYMEQLATGSNEDPYPGLLIGV